MACTGALGGETTKELTIRRGTFRERFLLTGELRAAEAVYLTVPRTPTWQVQIRWMEEDGAEVERGQEVLDLDNSAFSADLEDRKLAAAETENSLLRTRAEAVAAVADKDVAVARARAALEKARILAQVPEELLPGREYQERRLGLKRAEIELAKAQEDLEATRQARELEVEVQRIDLAKARREIEIAEKAIRSLSLEAPVDGVLVVEDHPWEGRKLQVGDTAWVGMTVMQIPDLDSLQVEAILPDVDEGRIRPGMEAVAIPDAFPEQRFSGRVIDIAPVAREIERRSQRRYFLLRIDLEQIDRERLRPGMSVKVEVFGDPIEDVLLAPREALDLSAEPPRAYLQSGATAELRLGPCNPSHCVVEEGVAEGQRLVCRQPLEPPGAEG